MVYATQFRDIVYILLDIIDKKKILNCLIISIFIKSTITTSYPKNLYSSVIFEI